MCFRVMENYEDFIRSRYNTLNDEDDDEDGPLTPSSLIVFHGARVLPPLLNEQERAEMRRLREAAVSLMKRRREEESHISSTDPSDDITDCDIITSSAPLTSTAHDDRSSNQPRASPEDDSPENTQITVLFENHETHGPRDTTRNTTTMMSSGYVTNDDTDVAGRSGRTEAPGSDIISHAPVDGATLEEEIVAPLPKPAGDPSSDPDEGPYRTSLQNLLKKSQEYRRRQRLLRSQSRAAEEHNLSDKENQEILHTQMCRTEGDASTDQRHALPAELPVTDSTQKSRPSSAARFTNIPTPKFCLSPVRCKKRSRIPGLVRRALGRPAPTDLIGSSDGNDTMMSSQTEQITQLELNLSSLKALISDLESTLTLSQTESPTDDGQKRPPTVTFSETVTAKDCGVGQENPASVRSVVGVLADTSNCSVDEAGSSVIGSSYDVDVPSGLWKQLTPETGGHEGVSRVKRRLLMNEDAAFSPGRETGSALCSTPRGLQSSAQMQEDQVTALMEDECRLQQDLLQSLALRYQFLRSVSFPCPSAGSRLEDTPSSLTASSVCTHAELTDASRQSCVPVSCRPLLAAVLRGFLTRRLLRTDRVSQLITTITDTRMFLQSLTEVSCSKHDVLLQERVSLQLRAARDELHQIFFSMSSSDQMKMIRCDRQLSRERQLRTHDHKVKGSLSAATRKALERKKLKLQRKTPDRKKFSPSSEDTWKLVPKICRVSKKISPLRGER
ncbi:centriolar coiled-coil protein of 110 kDa-like isoform X1 [Carassius auratus]|uniref:Centriolar coiled-coil protein of 110 kDa-like isoform X1 n=2 Tax=Carassius auratus TaxID=7957 RepID=A0A6P6NSD9_CARAU|nr:centriolar coiled-coil protein of 110 kDa-like isoform X1 [Carassius auratus]XP_026111798.1 centriolar coiled-coil protein of 110 kDa-like isoform X1 [Carassius auratus]